MVILTQACPIQRPFGSHLYKRRRDFQLLDKRSWSLKPLIPRVSEDQDTDYQLRAVAKLLADEMTANGQVIGIGTGVAVNEYLREISERLGDGRLSGVSIPSSDVSASEAAFLGVPLTTIEDVNGNVDLMVDVADELDLENLAYIVGRGDNGPQANQPSLPRVRQLLEKARVRVVVVDIAKTGRRLGGSVPVLIEANEDIWEDIAEELDDIFIGDAEIRRRSVNPDAGPRGGNSPVITTDGNMVLDVQFLEGLKLFGKDEIYDRIVAEIETVDGVLEHGLVVGVARKAVVGTVVVSAIGEDGQEEVKEESGPRVVHL